MEYIDAEKLKSIIKAQIKKREEWMRDLDRSARQDQLWPDLNGEDMSILQTINSLQQEQQEVKHEKETCEEQVREIKDAYSECYHKYAKIPRWIRWIFKAN